MIRIINTSGFISQEVGSSMPAGNIGKRKLEVTCIGKRSLHFLPQVLHHALGFLIPWRMRCSVYCMERRHCT